MKIFFTLSLLCTVLQLCAQITDQEVAPKYGVQELVVQYYGIEFSKEQKVRLRGKEIELIFLVDALGQPTLREVNGLSDADLLDSIEHKSASLPPFNPRIRNGQAEPSIYFLNMTFPIYQTAPPLWVNNGFHKARLEDFEYIHESGRKQDLVLDGAVNQFFGRPTEYLHTGFGFKMDYTYTNKNKLLFGLNMSVYSNKQKANYPVQTTGEFLQAYPTLLMGAIFGKWVGPMNVQAEIAWAVQNATVSVPNQDPPFVQFNGWSPGAAVNYPIAFGKVKTSYFYGIPNVLRNHLNLHLGIRYVRYPQREASGLMAELGVGFRMSIHEVDSFRLKK